MSFRSTICTTICTRSKTLVARRMAYVQVLKTMIILMENQCSYDRAHTFRDLVVYIDKNFSQLRLCIPEESFWSSVKQKFLDYMEKVKALRATILDNLSKKEKSEVNRLVNKILNKLQ